MENAYSNVVVNAGGAVSFRFASKLRAAGGSLLRRLGLSRLLHYISRSRMMRTIELLNRRSERLDHFAAERSRLRYTSEFDNLDRLVGLGARRSGWVYGDQTNVSPTRNLDKDN